MLALFAYLHAFVCSRHDLGLEILALRQQLSLLKRRHPRPRLNGIDRLFWITLRHLWSRWADALIVVKPETVIGWHRRGFRLFWTWKVQRGQPGRPSVPKDVRELIRTMSRDNPLWGAFVNLIWPLGCTSVKGLVQYGPVFSVLSYGIICRKI